MFERQRALSGDAKSSERTTPSARQTVVQRKLRVGSAADPAEREADRVADDVMRLLASADRPSGLAAGHEPPTTTRSARSDRAPADLSPGRRDPSPELAGVPRPRRARSVAKPYTTLRDSCHGGGLIHGGHRRSVRSGPA
jgi:hypothetical protein